MKIDIIALGKQTIEINTEFEQMHIFREDLIPLALALLKSAGANVITEKPGGFRPTSIVYAGLSDRTEIGIGSTVIIIQGEK